MRDIRYKIQDYIINNKARHQSLSVTNRLLRYQNYLHPTEAVIIILRSTIQISEKNYYLYVV